MSDGFSSAYVSMPSPFAVRPVEIGWVPNRSLQSQVKTLFDEPRFRHLGIVLVDLTHRSADPTAVATVSYAGLREDDQIFVGSLPKIAVMLAAYRLREQVREAAVRLGLSEPGALFPHLEKAWPPLIAKEANGRPVAFPKLRKIFAVDGFGDAKEIQFSDDFEHHIAAMIEGVGKNSAAAYCVDKLGFAYINGVLQWEGLQFGKLGQRGFRGLSLSLDYGGNSWGSGDGGAIAQGATAKAVAAFLTALENRNLVSKDASDGMTGHMLLASSWMKSGLTSKGRTPSSNYGKIGVFGTYSEGAVFEQVGGTGLRRYAAVVLGAANFEVLEAAAVNLDIISAGNASVAKPGVRP
jgi:hypothetical protein